MSLANPQPASNASGQPSGLLNLFSLITFLLGITGLLVASLLGLHCFGGPLPADAVALLARQHKTVHLWLQILLPSLALASAVLAIAGLGLLRQRRWALKLIVGYAAFGLAGVLFGIIIGFKPMLKIFQRPDGLTRASFTVKLSHPATNDVIVAYASRGENAHPGVDFVPTNGLLTIPIGDTQETLSVQVIGDSTLEAFTNAFALSITNAVGGVITRAEARITIQDDDALPQVAIGGSYVRERNHGTLTMTFPVTLSHPHTNDIAVDFSTADSTATANTDYIATNGTLIIPAWKTAGKINVMVHGDTQIESQVEIFTIALTNPRNASLSENAATSGMILDNEGIPTISILELAEPTSEPPSDDGTVTTPMAFAVTVSRPFPTPIDVAFRTVDGSASSNRHDYLPRQGTLRFHARQTNITVIVDVLPDYMPEPSGETLGLAIDLLGGNATLGVSNMLGTIADNRSFFTRHDPPSISLGRDVTVIEGSEHGEPVSAAMGKILRTGFIIGFILLLALPIAILWVIRHERVLQSLGIDPHSPTYTVGTLTYTKLGLTALFAWLLWGEFCWTIMEAVVPSILPLKLKALGSSNTLMVVILSTLPSILNLTICPWISFKSDRYRSRWGRRIPFILWSMPFLTASLILLGFGEEVSAWVRASLPIAQTMAPNTLTITIIAILMVLFQFFNMFVNSVFWYLFNDVVPAQFLGRFMGFFRLVGTAAGAVYNAFVFGYAETHMREILSGAALLYFVGFGLVCLRVKEGDYPPIAGEAGRPKGLLSDIKVFGKESFSVRFYWYLYLTGAFTRISYALGIFGIFMSKEMSMTISQIGKLAAVGSITGMVATYFTAVLVDRWHPMRITVYEKIFTAVAGYGGWIWLFVTLPGDLYFWLGLGGALVYTFNYQLTDAAGIPLLMRILPKSRYGQFSSASAMIRSVGMIVGGILAGLYMDFLKWMCNGSDYAYRLIFTWVWPFTILTTILYVMVYQEWKRHGGDTHYRPPAPWTPDGFEESVDKVQSAPAKPHSVLLALYLGLVAAILNVLIILAAMFYMQQHGLHRALWWYGWVLIPIKILITAITWWQIVSVKRDLRDLDAGKKPRYGVPHHGVFLVQAITGLVGFPIYWLQTIWMIRIDYENELILFGINTLLGGFAGIAALQLIRWIERTEATIPAHAQTPAELPA